MTTFVAAVELMYTSGFANLDDLSTFASRDEWDLNDDDFSKLLSSANPEVMFCAKNKQAVHNALQFVIQYEGGALETMSHDNYVKHFDWKQLNAFCASMYDSDSDDEDEHHDDQLAKDIEEDAKLSEQLAILERQVEIQRKKDKIAKLSKTLKTRG